MMPETRTRTQRLFDTVVGTILAALVLSFFAIMWRSVQEVELLSARSQATGEVISSEIAKLRTGLRRVEAALEEARRENVPIPEIGRPEAERLEDPSALTIQQSVQEQIWLKTKR